MNKEPNVGLFPCGNEKMDKAYYSLISMKSKKRDYSDILNPRNLFSAVNHLHNISGMMRRIENTPEILDLDDSELLSFIFMLIHNILFNSLLCSEEYRKGFMKQIGGKE